MEDLVIVVLGLLLFVVVGPFLGGALVGYLGQVLLGDDEDDDGLASNAEEIQHILASSQDRMNGIYEGFAREMEGVRGAARDKGLEDDHFIG